MSTLDMITVIESLKERESLLEEAKEQVETLKDSIKREMEARGVEELEAGTHIVRYTTVLSNRFDSTAFKKVMPDVYKAYTKQITARRFTVSG
ncbi:hypothetical protein D7X33_21795 [Butyricicoccus sp. 1XD8-22]|nr:hypothetical protein D7X33_21795 [Butyricicoccus sp. 1XD8-22]